MIAMTSCGFDSLPDQVTTRVIRHGLSFNVLVVGPTGIGKTTLINSIFNFDYGDSPDLERENTSVNLRVKEFRPQNKTLEMKLTIIETKGFDNQLDKSKSYEPIVEYINARNEEYLKDELRVLESRYNDLSDSRVHCCIYIISPTGSALNAIDIVTMKELHHRVCLIPVIGKSDVFTKLEKQKFKERVRQEILLNGIEIYSSEEHHLPLAVAASNDIVTENGKRQRVRDYPWGKINIENDTEFPRLRDLLLRNMISLMETTKKVHYERFRKEVSSHNFCKGDENEKVTLEQEVERLERDLRGHKRPILGSLKH